MTVMNRTLLVLFLSAFSFQLAAREPPVFEAEILQTFQTFDARQGVAVDAEHFYAVNNFSITKHDKRSGEPILQWDGISDVIGPLVHLDSGMVLDGYLYAPHSNYPLWPMTSSVEIWNTQTMEHSASHSFGVLLGSLTWLDRYRDEWWGAFANYDKIQDGMDFPYGETRNTVITRMDNEFNVLQNWTLPPAILARMSPMSNSGGAWGADGLLYLTGHDYPEVYVMDLPETSSELEWVATVHVPGLNGQGIAWDRSSDERILWGILKQDELVYRIRMPRIAERLSRSQPNYLRGPGEFETDR